MRIENKRFILRDFTIDDMSAYCDMKESNHYRRRYDDNDYTLEKASLLAESYNASFEEPMKKFVLALINAKTHRFIGICELTIEDNDEAVIEHILRTETGVAEIATEAFAQLTNYAFRKMGVKCIYSSVIEGNRIAQRVCTDSGMSLALKIIDNTFFKEKWWNTLVYQKYKMAA